MKSQKEDIRNHLENHGPISFMVALNEYGCARLPARIWELKREGMKIERTMIPVYTSRGNVVMVASYRMVE